MSAIWLPFGRSVTRTELISVRVIRMLCQLVGFSPIERANVKSDVLFDLRGIKLNKVDFESPKSSLLFIKVSTAASET